jgi:ribA/ribD-fused uncharacterized protein
VISAFRGQWRGLSNFAPCTVGYDGREYQSVEHAFQAAKTLDPAERGDIARAATAAAAKRLGRRVALRPDWDAIRIPIMLALLEQKFSRDPHRALLLLTGQEPLVEGNDYGDRFWGQCPVGHGQNWLGHLLETVRACLQLDVR